MTTALIILGIVLYVAGVFAYWGYVVTTWPKPTSDKMAELTIIGGFLALLRRLHLRALAGKENR